MTQDHGKIWPRYRTEFNNLWGSEVKTDRIAVLEHLEVREGFRRWGVGKWFFEYPWLSNWYQGVPKARISPSFTIRLLEPRGGEEGEQLPTGTDAVGTVVFLFVRSEPLNVAINGPFTGSTQTGAEHPSRYGEARAQLFRFYRGVSHPFFRFLAGRVFRLLF